MNNKVIGPEDYAEPRCVLCDAPYGAEQISVTVNGETRTEPTGLNGAQGWFALGIKGGDEVSLSMIAGGLSYSASLHGALGVMLIVE